MTVEQPATTTTRASRPARTLRDEARSAVSEAWQRAVETGRLPSQPAVDGSLLPPVEIERPAKPEHGDLATSIALKLARPYRRSPLDIANAMASELASAIAAGQAPAIAAVDVAPPGFINLRLSDAALEATIERILAEPEGWGRLAPDAKPVRVNIEFVSANPTGPLHIGNARGAFVGDLLARVLEAAGQQVTREYYFNDFGAQVQKLGASVLAVRDGQPIPDDGYHGEYVADLARDVPADVIAESELATETGEEAADLAIGRWASERVRAGIETSLERLGVHFDVWTTEGSLHRDGWVARAIERLRDGGHLYDQDGALWFRSTAFGDDKDRVIRKSNGDYTYFAADIGYVTEKFSRGFDRLIYVWGADHHGTVARVRNAAQAMGYDRDAVEMLLTGWVRFVSGGVEVSMSKRAGTFVTLDDLLAEVGADAARWFFGSRGANIDIDFDIELAKKESSENPVFYVQYAHARIASILRKATVAGLAPTAGVGDILAGAPEATLARLIVRLPEVVEDAAAAHETQAVTAYATELATAFHAFYRDARVVDSSEPARSGARLALVRAAQISLANSLALLGISAPESM